VLLTALLTTAATATALAQQAVPPSTAIYDPEQLPVTQGSVAQYSLTPRGDVDGVILQDGTQVHLPPHLGGQVVQAIKTGDSVTIRGLKAQALPIVQAVSVTDDTSGQSVVDSGPPATPPQPVAMGSQWLQVQGTVREPLYGPRGETNGALLEDGTQVHLPPDQAWLLGGHLQAGRMLVAEAMASPAPSASRWTRSGSATAQPSWSRSDHPARPAWRHLRRPAWRRRLRRGRRNRPRPALRRACSDEMKIRSASWPAPGTCSRGVPATHALLVERDGRKGLSLAAVREDRADAARTSEDEPSRRTLRGLDGINFLMADVRDGVGPYLSVFLKGGEHWDSGAIGIAMAASSIASAICQVPAGLLVDGTRAKRLLVAASGLIVATGCLLIVLFPHFATVVAAQAMLGAASAVIPPAIAALSLGLVGRRLLDARVSRNESFNHGGNFVAAGLAGLLGQHMGYDWIFYLVCAFAIASAATVTLINPAEIDHERARGGEDPGNNGEPMRFRDLVRRRDLRIFLLSVVLFHFGNAAMLPMAGQVLAQKHPGSDAIALSACIIAAQLVMVGVAFAVGRASARGFGRKSIFLVALAVLPLRGVLFSFTSSPYGVVAIQLLDGVAAGIFGVISVLIASDLMRGTGRFNLAQGLTALAVGIGAALSNATSGYIVQWFGYPAGFLYLACIALCALAFFAIFMPETKRPRSEPTRRVGAPRPRAA